MGSVEWSTAISQTAYVEELDRVRRLTNPDLTTESYNEYGMEEEPSLGTDILSLVVFYGLALYLQHQIVTKGKSIIQRASGRPLLFYAIDGIMREILNDSLEAPIITLEVLLNNGADPMEVFNGRTPWSHLVDRISNGDGSKPAQSGILKIYGLMLEHGADPTNRFETSASWTYLREIYWSPILKKKDYSTTFHHVLNCPDGLDEAIVKLLVDHCNDLEATDSDGIGIQEWADSLDLEIRDFLRQEIAAKNDAKNDGNTELDIVSGRTCQQQGH